MSEAQIIRGPGLSNSQRIGDLARAALHANKPDNWFLGDYPGDDFGYDFSVTVFDPSGQGAQCTLYVQLKGTTQEKCRLANGMLSFPFNRTTLNLWNRSGTAVFVVLVDLIDTKDPKGAGVYFYFASPDLDELLLSSPESQETISLHVDTRNCVHQKLECVDIKR